MAKVKAESTVLVRMRPRRFWRDSVSGKLHTGPINPGEVGKAFRVPRSILQADEAGPEQDRLFERVTDQEAPDANDA